MSAPFVEKTILSPLNGTGILVKNHLVVCGKIYFWIVYSISVFFMPVFMTVSDCFDYCSFVVSFEMREFESASFVLFQNYFGYSVSLESTYEF